MSSHHIVRENQEPALVVDSVTDLSEEYIGQILEWSPTIFTGDSCLDYFLLCDIKVDFLVSIGGSSVLAEQEMKRLPLTDSVIIDALAYLTQNDYKAVNVISSSIPQGLSTYCDKLNIVLFTGQCRYVYVLGKYEKWQVKGAKVLVEQDAIVSMSGLTRIDEHTYETTQEGFFSLVFEPDKYVRVGEVL